MDKKVYLSIIAACATLAAVWLLALLVEPIAQSLAWALIIGIATMPHYDRLTRKFPGKPGRAAGLMLLAVTVCFILPVVGLALAIAQNAPQWFQEAQGLVQSFTNDGVATLNSIPYFDRIITLATSAGIDLASSIQEFAGAASGMIIKLATNTAKGVAQLLFSIVMALFILFFIYRDGHNIVSRGLERFAANQPRLRRYLAEICTAIRAVTLGTIYTCIAQGVIAGIGYVFAGVPAAVLWGALTAVAALIPMVGTALIWLPLVIYLALQGAYLAAGLLALWCIVFVGLADNAIRPLAVGAQANISTLAIVLGAICGATAMGGVLGLILGPVVFAALATLWHEITNNDPANEPELLDESDLQT
jgi:predicted PurR-regulated permease PerM